MEVPLGGCETLAHWVAEAQPMGVRVAKLLMLALGESVALGVVDCEDVPKLLEDTLVLPLSIVLGWEVEEGVVQCVGEREGEREAVAHPLALVEWRVEGVPKTEAVRQPVEDALSVEDGDMLAEPVPLAEELPAPEPEAV